MIRRRDHATHKKPLAAFLRLIGMPCNGRHAAITEIDKIAEKPCQVLFSVFC
jgi:hypothetical protein